MTKQNARMARLSSETKTVRYRESCDASDWKLSHGSSNLTTVERITRKIALSPACLIVSLKESLLKRVVLEKNVRVLKTRPILNKMASDSRH